MHLFKYQTNNIKANNYSIYPITNLIYLQRLTKINK